MDVPSPEDLYLDQLEIDGRRAEALERNYPSCGRCGWRHRATTADCLYPLPAGDSGEVPISTEADHGE